MELRVALGAITVLMSVLLIAGCTPPGPRALLKGKKRLDAGRYADAIVQFETATSLMETNAQTWNYLGLAYHHLKRRDDAAKAYERALNLDRTLAEARYNLGCLYLEENKLDAARSAFIAYSLDRQNAPEGYLKLGAVLSGIGDLPGAEKAFYRVLSLSTNNPEALTGLGVVRQKRGKGLEAAQFFAAALKQDPSFGPALLNSGVVAQDVLHDESQAIRHYQRYLALYASSPMANDVSNALRQLQHPPSQVAGIPAPRVVQGRDIPQSKPEQRPPASAVPSDPLVYKYISPGKPVVGKTQLAEKAFLEGVQAHRKMKIREAIEYYRRAVELDPAFYSAHFNLGLVCAGEGDFAAASRAYEIALAIRPDSRDARYNFALLLKQFGYLHDSVVELERLVIFHPKDARAHITLGNMYAQQFKNKLEARDHYTKALEVDPQNAQAGAIRYWLTENRN